MKRLACAILTGALLIPATASAQTYACKRPSGWTAEETSWARDELLRPIYYLALDASSLSIFGPDPGRPAAGFARQLSIVFRDEERVVAAEVTDSGAQLFQFFFGSGVFHWIDSHALRLRLPNDPPVRLQAFVTTCAPHSG